jgi:hypothetical protein
MDKMWKLDRTVPVLFMLIGFVFFGIPAMILSDLHEKADITGMGPCFAYRDDDAGRKVTAETTSGFSLKMSAVEVKNPKKERVVEYEGQTYTIK